MNKKNLLTYELEGIILIMLFFGCSNCDLEAKSSCENCVHAFKLFHTSQESADCFKPTNAYTVFCEFLNFFFFFLNHFISEKLGGVYGWLSGNTIVRTVCDLRPDKFEYLNAVPPKIEMLCY